MRGGRDWIVRGTSGWKIERIGERRWKGGRRLQGWRSPWWIFLGTISRFLMRGM